MFLIGESKELKREFQLKSMLDKIVCYSELEDKCKPE